MEVVLPRHPDAAVHLDAVLEELDRVVADVGLGAAREQRPVVGALVIERGGEAVSACEGGFEPDADVGDPVLERLIRRQRSAEAPPVRQPLERDGEARVHRTGGLGNLDEEGEIELPFDLSRHVRHGAVGIEHHLVEDDLHVLPGEVDRPHGTDLDARCRRGSRC